MNFHFDFDKIKFIVLDIDGTITDGNSLLSCETVKAVRGQSQLVFQ